MARHFDVVVVGGGAAGLTAGIYLGRAKVKTLIVDQGVPGGQMVLTHAVANYPGVEDVSGATLAWNMKKQAQHFGCEIMSQTDLRFVDLQSSPKRLELEDEGEVTADAVIIATGGRPRTLGLPGEDRFKGQGISYCATCDGDFFTDMEIVAIGGGNSALEEAVSLSKHASKVTIVHEFDEFQAQPWAVKAAQAEPKVHFEMAKEVLEFVGEERLEAVVVRDKHSGEIQRIDARGAFVFIGYQPSTDALQGVLELSERGEILTDELMATSVDRIFAAGDNRAKRYRQITTAVADGTVAALSAIEALGA